MLNGAGQWKDGGVALISRHYLSIPSLLVPNLCPHLAMPSIPLQPLALLEVENILSTSGFLRMLTGWHFPFLQPLSLYVHCSNCSCLTEAPVATGANLFLRDACLEHSEQWGSRQVGRQDHAGTGSPVFICLTKVRTRCQHHSSPRT